ncbi:hypothetical protein [Nocardia nova]|uniref:hypothetical protein n=1 Tax=Nocardia nova TaxID=37330 RepID=UPI00189318DC|nr:hypothetical protein [Nocardia nova]MBF6150020.1 hypothetical protein [Nocardia nova]MDN2499634.1 hypothetical protein [Nocardia nova]
MPAASLELVAIDGTRYYLRSLLSKCQQEPDARWPHIVYDHFTAAGVCAPFPPTRDPVADHIRVQVAPPHTADRRDSKLLHAKPISSDIDTAVPLAGLLLDSPGTETRTGEHAVRGRDADELWTLASANTAAEPIDHRNRLERNDVVIDVLEGRSPFVASKITVMSYLIASEIGPAPYGVLVAIPDQHMIAFHRLSSAANALFTGYLLIDFAAHFAERGSAPVTREIFYWYDGQMQQLTRTDPEGVTDLHITGAFEQVFREMP